MQNQNKAKNKGGNKNNPRITHDQAIVTFPNNRSHARLNFLEAELAAARRMIATQQERIGQLERLSFTDELTRVYNRRGFYHQLERELLAVARKTGKVGCLMLIDLDNFKLINDTYGHPAGDAYLQTVAKTLQKLVRANDHIARLGGDEFAVILTDIDAATALMRATAIERAFNAQHTSWEGTSLPLRGSFGATVFRSHDEADELMNTVDLKLYASKLRRKENKL